MSPNELDIKYALKEVIRVDVELSNGDIIPLDANGYFTLEGDLPIVADVLLFNTEGEAEGAPELTLYRLNESTNVYKEYMLVNGVFEQIGDTAVSLDGYATEDYVDNSIAPLVAQLQGINNSTVIDVINQKITEKLTIANDTTPGVVLSAKDVDSEPVANSVYVGETGLMTVKKITTDILENGENELILFGGKA